MIKTLYSLMQLLPLGGGGVTFKIHWWVCLGTYKGECCAREQPQGGGGLRHGHELQTMGLRNGHNSQKALLGVLGKIHHEISA